MKHRHDRLEILEAACLGGGRSRTPTKYKTPDNPTSVKPNSRTNGSRIIAPHPAERSARTMKSATALIVTFLTTTIHRLSSAPSSAPKQPQPLSPSGFDTTIDVK